jgi:ABC-type branched-subunit amino acid transport system substrate-binding protein
MKNLKLSLLSLSLLLLTQCASQQVNSLYSGKYDSPRIGNVEPEAKANFVQAERYFFAGDYDRALPLYQGIRSRFQKGKAGQLASYRIGSIFYYQQDYTNAAKEFSSFILKYPQSDIAFDVTYNWAAAEFQRENPEKANEVLSRLKLSEVYAQGPKRAEIVFELAAQVSKSLDNQTGAILAYLAELQLPLPESQRIKIEDSIVKSINSIQSPSELKELQTQIKEEHFRNKISNRLAVIGLQRNDNTSVSVKPTLPSQPMTEINPVKNQGLTNNSSGDRTAIGVVLPLTGKFASYGRKALDAILLATKSFFPNQEDNIQVIVEDSRSNPIVASNAVEKLVNDHQVMAIIGPFSWKESVYAADKAQELGVLNISLSGKEGISERGAYIFQNAITPKVQLESLVFHCINNLKMTRFALLVPDNNFGKEYSSTFWSAVERLGGKIVAYDSYNPDEKDFQKNVQELVGLNPKYRRMEMAKLIEFQKLQKEKTGKEPKIKLQPIIDFEALFIPDSPKTVAQIAANLAYYDIKGVTLLGTTEWNSDQLYKRGGRYVEGALFPGGLNLNSQNSIQATFIRNYTAAYGTSPGLLATQAYEAMSVVVSTLKLSNSSDRNQMVNLLQQQSAFTSPLGTTLSFDNNRVAKRSVPIFKLNPNGAIVQQ